MGARVGSAMGSIGRRRVARASRGWSPTLLADRVPDQLRTRDRASPRRRLRPATTSPPGGSRPGSSPRPTPCSRAASPSPAAVSRPSPCTSTAPGSCPAHRLLRQLDGQHQVDDLRRRRHPRLLASAERRVRPRPSPSPASSWPQPGAGRARHGAGQGRGPSVELPGPRSPPRHPARLVVAASGFEPRLPQRRHRRPRQGPQLLEARRGTAELDQRRLPSARWHGARRLESLRSRRGPDRRRPGRRLVGHRPRRQRQLRPGRHP